MESFGTDKGTKPNVEKLTPEQILQREKQEAEETAANLDKIEEDFLKGQDGLAKQVTQTVEDNRKQAKKD